MSSAPGVVDQDSSRPLRLHLRGHSGTAGRQSSVAPQGAGFSTRDQDNDNCDHCRCALMLTGGKFVSSGPGQSSALKPEDLVPISWSPEHHQSAADVGSRVMRAASDRHRSPPPGWWFDACGFSNLNGVYYGAGHNIRKLNGIRWHHFRGPSYSLRATSMMVRPYDF